MSTINVKLDNNSKNKLFRPKIVVFGVGGGGGNAINNMIRSNLEGVEFVAANTDKQALELSMAENKLQLGSGTTMGLGAGTVPEVGKTSAEESIEEIEKYLEGANMLFITAGMGGGTGTGASPVIARVAKEKGILTVGIVTRPFEFEGVARVEIGDYGISELRKYVDTLMVISNQNLFKISNINTGFSHAFNKADDVLHNSVRSITDLITAPGLINLDFADVKTTIKKMGEAVMGIGEASGENRVIGALEDAISNPLLNNASIEGARGVIVNISGGSDMTMFEVEEVMAQIYNEVDPNANIILGTALNEALEGKLRISIVATGINVDEDDDSYNYNNFENSPLEKFAKEQEYQQYKKDLQKKYNEVKFKEDAKKEEGFESSGDTLYMEKTEVNIIKEGNFEFNEEELEDYEEEIQIENFLSQPQNGSDIITEGIQEKEKSTDSLYIKNPNVDMMDFFNPVESINPNEEELKYGKKSTVKTEIRKYNFPEKKKKNLSELGSENSYFFNNLTQQEERGDSQKVEQGDLQYNVDDSLDQDYDNIDKKAKEEKEIKKIRSKSKKEEGRTLFGSIFKRGQKSEDDQQDLSRKDKDKDKNNIKIHNSEGKIKLNTLDNFNSDVEVEENDLSDVPAYLRKK
ncbi:cell division protein FtsZ [Pseudomonadota bacterium]